MLYFIKKFSNDTPNLGLGSLCGIRNLIEDGLIVHSFSVLGRPAPWLTPKNILAQFCLGFIREKR